MHARHLVEIAGHLGVHARPLLESGAAVCGEALAEYWIASRCRIDHWGRWLRALGHSQSCPPPREAGDLLERLAEELTLSESLARIVCAVCSACDCAEAAAEAGPIGANTLEAHRDATSRMRALTFAWWPGDSPRTKRAAALAARVEHWTDMLLARLAPGAEAQHLAHDAARFRDFVADGPAGSGAAAARLVALGLRTGFASADHAPLCPDLNRRIGGAALALFGPAGFDGHGLVRPVWMLRAERTADEAVALVDKLFASPEAGSGPSANRLPVRWWM